MVCPECNQDRHPLAFAARGYGRCRECQAARNKASRDANRHAPQFAGSKACVRCGQTLNLIKFYRDAQSVDGRSSWCRGCVLELGRKSRQTNAHRIAARREFG